MAHEFCARASHARPARTPRPLVLIAVLATVAALLGVTAASSTASPAHASAPAARRSSSAPAVDAAHPFSNPVWLPLHTAFGVDCAGSNPGCKSHRPFFSIDMVPTGQYGRHPHTSHAKVFAMGAGVLHVGQAHGTRCGSTRDGSFGTWVWIDHGAGIVSRYGHLSKILVKNGAHVAAGTAIGVVGATGKAKNCNANYVDFMVDHNGLANDNSHHIDTLRTCSTSGAPQTWPAQAVATKGAGSDVRVHFSRWDAVRQGTQFPASSGACIPGGLPATTSSPSAVRVTKPATNHLTVHWAPAAGARRAVVELSVYHPSEHSWARAHNEVWRTVSASADQVTVTKLMRHHVYRARVTFLSPVGASRGSSWVSHRD